MATPLESLTESQLRLEREQLQNAQSLTDIEKQRLQFITDRLSALDEERSKTKDLANTLSKLLKLEESQNEILKSTVISFGDMADRASNLYKTVLNLKNPSTIFLELLKLSVDRFIELDKAGQSFRETTGFLADQTSNVEITLRRTSRDLATFGVNVENANAAAQKIAETFSSVSLVTDEIVGHVALMEKNLGVSVDDSTAVMQNFMGIGQISSTIANQTAGAAASLSKAAGVPFAKAMKDVATAGGEVFKLVRGSVDALVKGAIEARRLGLELKDVGAAADKFLDFQTSINSEMEASVLFGKDINFTRARELSYAGDLAGLAKEQSRILKEIGDLRKLDAFQTKALAESMGLSVDQLIKMNAKQQELNELRRKNPDLAAQYERDLDVLNTTNETLEEKYKREIQSRQIASQQQKIMNDIQQIMVELSEILLPIVKLFVGILVPVIKIGAALVKFILTPIRLINDSLEGWYKNSEIFRNGINSIASGFQSLVNSMDTEIGKWVGGIIGSIVIIGYIIKKELIQNMLSYLNLFKKIPISVPTPTPTPTGLGPGGFGGYGSTVARSTGGMSVGAVGDASTGGPATSPSRFMNSMKGINPATVLSLGAALIMFAGAMYILAKAGQQFNTVDWSSLGKMGVILAALGLTIAGLMATGVLETAAGGIALLGLAFIPFAISAMAAGKAMQMFGQGIESIGTGIKDIAANMSALASLDDMLLIFKDASLILGIYAMANAIGALNTELNGVATNLPALKNLESIRVGAGGGNAELVNKLDELIVLMKNGGIAVNIDGSKVSTAVGVATKFRGAY
jgi:hypothetical protein